MGLFLGEHSEILKEMDRKLSELAQMNAKLDKLTQMNAKLDKLTQLNSQLDELTQLNQELNASVTKMKREETAMARRLERVERLLEMGSYGVTREKRDVPIVVSFTSYGKRIETVPLMLERIFNQTLKPDRVLLYLARDNFPGMEEDLPERLLDMRGLGLEIRWCEEDIKSYKKILPALRDFPDAVLITVDDDLYYELDMIEKLYNSYRKHPDAVSAMRVHRIAFDEKGRVLPYDQWKKEDSDENQLPSGDLMATTGAGTLFPPHILPEEVFDTENLRKLCPDADDVWIMVMCMRKGVKVVPPAKKQKLKYIGGTQKERLWDTNKSQNDIQLQSVLEKYPIPGWTI